MRLFYGFIIIFLNVFQTSYGVTSLFATSQNQIDLFNAYSKKSWQSRTVRHSKGYRLPISDAIINIFNVAIWDKGAEDKITPPISALENFSAHLESNFKLDDNPEEWLSKISFKEIMRFKNFLKHNNTLISDDNFANDDLVKVRAMSGVFWVVDTSGAEEAEATFTGMLVPGQSFGLMTYQVLTCFHGFRRGNKTDNVAYYFVPYGVAVDARPGRDNYVVNKGFKVTHVTHYRRNQEMHQSIDDQYFDKNSFKISDQMLYSERDLAIAFVEGKTLPQGSQVHEKTLHTVLLQTNLNLFHAGDTHLPMLPYRNEPLSVGMDKTEERLFNIGLAAEPELEFSHNMIVSTSLRVGDSVGRAPRRAFISAQNVKNPDPIDSRREEGASFVASYAGMSGGPILRCKLTPDSAGKKCVIIATLWGDGRIFDESSKIISLKSIVNLTG